MNLNPTIYEHRIQAFREGAVWANATKYRYLMPEEIDKKAAESQVLFRTLEDAEREVKKDDEPAPLTFTEMQANQTKWKNPAASWDIPKVTDYEDSDDGQD